MPSDRNHSQSSDGGPTPGPPVRNSASGHHANAHSVGTEDGGSGLPITGWNTQGGDLRIGHFLGVHALQFIPLLALGLVLLARRFPRLRPEGTRTALVFAGTAAYAGLIWLVTWQALRGESVAHPGTTTLAAAGGLLGGAALAALGALGLRRKTHVSATIL